MNKINLFKHELLKWSKKNKRKYSWRDSNDPWKILLLEIIAQQTQLDRANIYYEKFIKIRKILEPNDTWIDNFQWGYFEKN